ncbi:MAG TPA: hypothetical protein PLH79_20140, partial [bacterium]|nr:hypothetical protein [bacterium]
EVFKYLRQQEVRFYSVVKDKEVILKSVKERNSVDPSYRYAPNELYDTLVTALFQGLHRLPDRLIIFFAVRGKGNRTKSLQNALEQAEEIFRNRFGFNRNYEIHIQSGYPPQMVCLQAVDYYLWALQRFYECREGRYINALWHQVGEIYDVDLRVRGKTGVYFRKDKPLNLDTRPLK